MPSLKHCVKTLVDKGEVSASVAAEVERLTTEYVTDGYTREKAEQVALDDLLKDAKGELTTIYKEIGVRPVIDKLPDELEVWGNGAGTVKAMREAVTREPYKKVLQEFIAKSENEGMVDEAKAALQSKDAQRIMKLARKIERTREAYANSQQDLRRESYSVNPETGNDVLTLNQVNEHEEGVTEIEEMNTSTLEKTEGIEDGRAFSKTGTGVDLDMAGNAIPERDITKPVGAKQIKFIKDLLTKGVPAFVKAVKAMTEQQRHNIRAVTRELLKTDQLDGDLKTRAAAALKALRGVAEEPVTKQGVVEESAEASIDKHYRSMIKTALPEKNTPVWALFKDDGDGNPTTFVGYSTNMGAAQYVAEQDDLVLVNDTSANLKRSTKNSDITSDAFDMEGIKFLRDALAKVEGKEQYLPTIREIIKTLKDNGDVISMLDKYKDEILSMPQELAFAVTNLTVEELDIGARQNVVTYIQSVLGERTLVNFVDTVFLPGGESESVAQHANLSDIGKQRHPDKADVINFAAQFIRGTNKSSLIEQYMHHEVMHAVIARLLGDSKYRHHAVELIKTASSKSIKSQLATLHDGDQRFLDYIEKYPEEAAACAFQHWANGELNLDQPNATSVFQKLRRMVNLLRDKLSGRKHMAALFEVVHSGLTKDYLEAKSAEEVTSGKRKSKELGFHSQQSPVSKSELPSSEEQQAVIERIVTLLGEQVRDKVKLVKELKEGLTLISGQVTFDEKGMTELLQISLNAESLNQVADHEAMHQLFAWLRANGSKETVAMLERMAQNGILRKRLEALLADDAAALKQLADPEEFLAYLFQFWRAGRIQLGPQNQGAFQKVWSLVKGLLQQFRIIGAQHTTEQDVAAIFSEFAAGRFAKGDRNAVIQALEKDAQAVAARRANSKAFWEDGKIHTALRKAAYTAQGTLKSFDNTALDKISQEFHIGTGDKMTRQGYLEAKAQKSAEFLNRLNNMLSGMDPSDLELVRDGLLKRERPKDAGAGRIFDNVQAYLKDMRKYLADSGVKRFDAEKHEWVELGTIIDNYFPRVFDAQKIAAEQQAFVDRLLEVHPNQLQLIADQANKEIAERKPAAKGTASHTAIKEHKASVTKEDVAKAIADRLVNGLGDTELDESTSALGMTPLMRSVNRRQLTWLDDAKFAEYMSQDVVGTLASYTVQAVKRAEYVKRFDNDGVKLRELMDQALIEELGGKKLVQRAEKLLPEKIKEWKKEYAKQAKAGVKHDDRPSEPTLRSVALEELRADRAAELNRDERAVIPPSETAAYQKKLDELSAKAYSEVLKREVAALQKLQPAAQAVMALEGTIGYSINPNVRRLAGAVMTYQNWRLLILALFGSMVDPLGIIVRGGEMQDAWNAFARGLREVRKGWKGEKSTDELSQLAEYLGTVDAGTFLDALGQTYSSLFMYGKLKRVNDTLFRLNGLEAWNRAMRIQATGAAVGFIKSHLRSPTKESARYLQDELGLDPADKSLFTEKGELDYTRDDVRQAIMRWVDTAIIRPNAAMRPLLASDPHYAVFYHLKSFTYAFHKTILERVVNEAKHDNYVPALYLLSIYTPVMIAADAAKEMLIVGDDDPAWMKQGLGGAIKHGAMRANLATDGGVPIPGIPGMYAGSAKGGQWFDSIEWFGPAVDQVRDFVTIPFSERRTVVGELVGALPGGSVFRKYAY